MKTRGVLFWCAAMLIVGTASAGVLRVEQDGSGDYLLIQDAVDAAADGDTILIGPGRYDDLQPRGDNNVVCVARWDDNRSLTFIGEDSATVIIGPATYEPVGTGPQGIHQHEPADVRVESVTFENLRVCVLAGRGNSFLRDVRCLTGEVGLYVQDPDTCIVRDCTFSNFEDFSVATFRATYAEVEDCELESARIYFGSTQYGVVRRSTGTGEGFVQFSASEGLVEHCDVLAGVWLSCVSVSAYVGPPRSTVNVRNNVFRSGGGVFSIAGPGARVEAEGNIIYGPADAGAIFQLGERAAIVAHRNHINRVESAYLVKTSDYSADNDAVIDLGSNYWYEDGTPTRLDSLIHDGHDDPDIHVFVNYDPILTEPVPAEKSSLGGVKALFR